MRRRLECDGVLEREVAELFHGLLRKGNLANHDLHGDHATALKILPMAWQLGVWFQRTFGDPQFRSGPFQPPQPPATGDPELAEELGSLREALPPLSVLKARWPSSWRRRKWPRLNRVFGGELDGVLQQFQRELWAA